MSHTRCTFYMLVIKQIIRNLRGNIILPIRYKYITKVFLIELSQYKTVPRCFLFHPFEWIQDEPPPPPETLGRSTRTQPHRISSSEAISQLPQDLPEDESAQQGEPTPSQRVPNCNRHFVAKPNRSQMAQVRLSVLPKGIIRSKSKFLYPIDDY